MSFQTIMQSVARGAAKTKTTWAIFLCTVFPFAVAAVSLKGLAEAVKEWGEGWDGGWESLKGAWADREYQRQEILALK